MKQHLLDDSGYDLIAIGDDQPPTPRQWFGLVLMALGICVVAYILVVAYLIALTPR